jgi:hypothetical protein
MNRRLLTALGSGALVLLAALVLWPSVAPGDENPARPCGGSDQHSSRTPSNRADVDEEDAEEGMSAATSDAAADCVAVDRAIQHAKRFLTELAPLIDPVRLRTEYGMKGNKFYVEYLNAWAEIQLLSSDEERAAIRQLLEPVVARTDSGAYHNLATCSDEEFKQDIISYLSACLLHRDFGFETAEYLRHVEEIVPRILAPEHLRMRGVDNTMALVYRLRQLGFEGGPAMCQIWRRPGSVTYGHVDLTKLDLRTVPGWLRVYDMTHEIFYLTEFGGKPMQCVGEGDLQYIRGMHAELIPIFIDHRNLDLLAELLMDLNYLKMTELPAYSAGRSFLLENQNEDGSWGDHEMIARNVQAHHAVNPKYLPKVGQYLHTTRVALAALCYPCETGGCALP